MTLILLTGLLNSKPTTDIFLICPFLNQELCYSLFIDVTRCGINQYKCKNGRKCIDMGQVCDSVSDCEDGDDEEFKLCSKFYLSCGLHQAKKCL